MYYNNEKVYAIASGETDATQRYVMNFNRIHALMSTHLTSMIKLSGKILVDFGIMESIDSRSLQIIDQYIKHYATSEQSVLDKIESSSVFYHKIGHLPILKRCQIDDFETMLLGDGDDIFYGESSIKLATSVLYLGVDALMYAIQKLMATTIGKMCYGENKTYRNIAEDRIDLLKYLFRLTKFTNNEIIEFQKTDTYKNFCDSLFRKYYVMDNTDSTFHPYEKYKLLADMFSLTQLDTSCGMHYLGSYFIGIIQLLFPVVTNDIINSWTANFLNLPNYFFHFELLCQLNQDLVDKISVLTSRDALVDKFPPEIKRLRNLNKIQRILNSDVQIIDGFKLVKKTYPQHFDYMEDPTQFEGYELQRI